MPLKVNNLLKNNRGSALIQAMLAMLAVTFVIATFTQMQSVYQSQIEQEKKRSVRDEIAKNLMTQVVKEGFINASTSTLGVVNSGNQMLYECVGYDKVNANDASFSSGEPKCDPNQAKDIGIEFLLRPSINYSYPSNKGKKNNINCPDPINPTHISCYLAGKNGKDSVGYNFKGEVGRFGSDFPLEAKVFFKPLCPSKNKSCFFAEAIEVRVELTHWLYAKDGHFLKKKGFLGVYPKAPFWQQVNASDLAGTQCNEGAVVYSDKDGQMLCRCHTPYRYIGADNSKGQLCELQLFACPSDHILVGRRSNGEAICQQVGAQDMYIWKITVDESKSVYTADCHEQNGETRGGWMSSVKERCKSSYEVKEVEHPASGDLRTAILGGAIGFLISLIILLVHMIFIVATGNVVGGIALLGYICFIFTTIVGAAIGYIAGLSWDWSIVSKDKNNPTALVRCTYEVECRAFKPPPGP